MSRIELDLKYNTKILKKTGKGYYMTYLDALIHNPHTGEKSLVTKRFLFDTGAAITILNSSFRFLFYNSGTNVCNTPIIDNVTVQYGGSRVSLPVFRISLKIKGEEFDMLAAFDKNMKLPSLLGHFDFINKLEHVGISRKRHKLTLIR